MILTLRHETGSKSCELYRYPTGPTQADMLMHHCPGCNEELSGASCPNFNIYPSPWPPSDPSTRRKPRWTAK
eukprot:307629-Prymnesium_polylepis.1